MTEHSEIRAIIHRMDDASGSELEDLRELLVPYGGAIIPHLDWAMQYLKRQGSRNAILYTAIKFGRVAPDAIAAARTALDDHAVQVRRTATLLLAFSLDRASLTALEDRLLVEPRDDIKADIAAAIDAISHGNHNLWLDRDHSGSVTLNIIGAIYPP